MIGQLSIRAAKGVQRSKNDAMGCAIGGSSKYTTQRRGE